MFLSLLECYKKKKIMQRSMIVSMQKLFWQLF